MQWVLIDGPRGLPGSRDEKAPTLLRFCCSQGRRFLVDSFRDGELQILRRWRNDLDIGVERIYPAGNGLATGCVR
jgi:hypothetical protein